MEDSTLRPTPSFNANIPVVTAAGGTNIAYKDPNSPEAILKRTTELNAQVAVDTKYDVATSPYYENFQGCNCGCHKCPYCRHAQKKTTDLQILLFVTIILFVAVISLEKLTVTGRIFLVTLCVALIILILRMYHH